MCVRIVKHFRSRSSERVNKLGSIYFRYIYLDLYNFSRSVHTNNGPVTSAHTFRADRIYKNTLKKTYNKGKKKENWNEVTGHWILSQNSFRLLQTLETLPKGTHWRHTPKVHTRCHTSKCPLFVCKPIADNLGHANPVLFIYTYLRICKYR